MLLHTPSDQVPLSDRLTGLLSAGWRWVGQVGLDHWAEPAHHGFGLQGDDRGQLQDVAAQCQAEDLGGDEAAAQGGLRRVVSGRGDDGLELGAEDLLPSELLPPRR